MTPFAIAGIQMFLGHGSNLDHMRQRIDLTMHLYPWVQMVMFSELAVFGPMLHHAQPLPQLEQVAAGDDPVGVVVEPPPVVGAADG